MKIKILALGLILVGGLGLLYGRSTYAPESHEASVGPNDPSEQDGETVHFPDLAGVIALLLGGGTPVRLRQEIESLVRSHR